MMVKLRTFARFRDILGGELDLNIEEGAKVSDLLDVLFERSQNLQDLIFESSGDVKEDVNMLVNGRHIESLERVETRLIDGDEVALFPAVVGG